jgi:hypothetical protein
MARTASAAGSSDCALAVATNARTKANNPPEPLGVNLRQIAGRCMLIACLKPDMSQRLIAAGTGVNQAEDRLL